MLCSHLSKRTQFEHPSRTETAADREASAARAARRDRVPAELFHAVPAFAREPAALPGELVTVALVKGVRGFGFSLIGSEVRDESFLQVKNIVRHGPADLDGRIHPGASATHSPQSALRNTRAEIYIYIYVMAQTYT